MLAETLFLLQLHAAEPVVGSEVWSGGGNYGMIMVLLLVLIGGLIAAFVFVKRMGLPRMKKSGALELLETRPLGGRQFILVGKYGNERFLLGVCPGKIEYLCSLKGSEVSDESEFAASLSSEIKKDLR